MSKRKSIILCALLLIWAISLFGMGYTTPALTILSLSGICLINWLHKVLRDQSLNAQARLLPTEPQTNPDQTTQGSRRLFVPQPIDK